jgi:DNA-binding HxlR family transcriptional regulator
MTTTGIPQATSYCEGRSCEQEVARAISLVAGRWAVPVLEALVFAGAPVRFRELQRRVGGISQKELSRQLAAFVHHGIAHRRADALHPTRVDYSLTPRGHALLGQMDQLGRWLLDPARERPRTA